MEFQGARLQGSIRAWITGITDYPSNPRYPVSDNGDLEMH